MKRLYLVFAKPDDFLEAVLSTRTAAEEWERKHPAPWGYRVLEFILNEETQEYEEVEG